MVVVFGGGDTFRRSSVTSWLEFTTFPVVHNLVILILLRPRVLKQAFPEQKLKEEDRTGRGWWLRNDSRVPEGLGRHSRSRG